MQENNKSELERLDAERNADFLNMLKGFVLNQVLVHFFLVCIDKFELSRKKKKWALETVSCALFSIFISSFLLPGGLEFCLLTVHFRVNWNELKTIFCIFWFFSHSVEYNEWAYWVCSIPLILFSVWNLFYYIFWSAKSSFVVTREQPIHSFIFLDSVYIS